MISSCPSDQNETDLAMPHTYSILERRVNTMSDTLWEHKKTAPTIPKHLTGEIEGMLLRS